MNTKNYSDQDTIIAISTATSDAGIGIIRLSGEKAIECVDKCVVDSGRRHNLCERSAGTIRFSYVVEEDESVLDEALVSVFKCPHSYTGEDMVEINVHGGRLILQKTLKLLLNSNPDRLRIAEPGEFTKRAFLNGKMDLTRAEAIQDIISAESDFALKNAARQLSGDLYKKIDEIRKAVLYETAFIESALDDPDNYEIDKLSEGLPEKITNIISSINRLLISADEGKIRKEGLKVSIIGEPNAGKSSLLNLLTGEESAIVTDIAGTTRDVLNESIKIGDLLLNISDTAGLRQTDDKVEAIGVKKAEQNAQNSDLILFVLDAYKFLKEDKSILTDYIKNIIRDKKICVLVNKSDLLSEETFNSALNDIKKEFTDTDERFFLKTSFKNKEGIDKLRDVIYEMFLNGETVPKAEIYLTNIRHEQALKRAKESLELVINTAKEGRSEDLYTVDLMDAYSSLSEILGEGVEDDLADEIFSKFCMGK